MSPGSPLDAARFVAVSSHDAVANQDVGGELPSDMCRRVGCYAGINADFADAVSRQPVGGVVSAAACSVRPSPDGAQLNVTRDGRLSAGPLDWSGSVSGNGRTVAIGGVNVAPTSGDVVLYTPAWAGNTPDGADTELVVRSAGSIGALGATTVLEIVGLRSDPGPIPANGAVLAARGSASAALHEFAAGGQPLLDLRLRTGLDVVESVGGSPAVLRDGQPAFADVDDSFTRARHPRSLVGWNPAGEVVLVAVDAGHDGASGMTLAEAADLLRGLGATDGFGFDNATVTFVAAGEVQNLPVDDGTPAPSRAKDGRWHRATSSARRPTPSWSSRSRRPRRPRRRPPTRGRAAASRRYRHDRPGQADDRRRGRGAGRRWGRRPVPAGSGGTSILGGSVSDILEEPQHQAPPPPDRQARQGQEAQGR